MKFWQSFKYSSESKTLKSWVSFFLKVSSHLIEWKISFFLKHFLPPLSRLITIPKGLHKKKKKMERRRRRRRSAHEIFFMKFFILRQIFFQTNWDWKRQRVPSDEVLVSFHQDSFFFFLLCHLFKKNGSNEHSKIVDKSNCVIWCSLIKFSNFIFHLH